MTFHQSVFLVLPLASAAAAAEPSYPPLRVDAAGFGKNIQRTMRLLATSTAAKPNEVRILFYGQSITEQNWTPAVVADLKARFPHARLITENRSLGGFSSQLLVKTADSDLFPFEPDLLIFHVYGAHDKYEDILRRVRERTTAEILQQTDHVTKPADFTEETDPEKLPPRGDHWDAFMNHNWLPTLARKYHTELCDQRALWKIYLTSNKLEPRALLGDAVHLNAHGEFLMGECVKSYLRYDPSLGPSPAEEWVKTYAVGKDLNWTDGKLRLEFEGSRVDVLFQRGKTPELPAAAVTIDGAKPSSFPGTLAPTRALATPGGKWPVVAGFGWTKPPVAEDWTMNVKKDPADDKVLTFTVTGSATGPDGSGRSDRPFVSNSGRLAIEPEHWQVEYALALAQVKPVPDSFTVRWSMASYAVDEFNSPAATDGRTTMLARGLPPGRHLLEIVGSPETPIAAIRVHRPPLVAR
ncbi:MAG: SGNH/GDSL hydrolase family protein [Planctomycetia bacterium]